MGLKWTDEKGVYIFLTIWNGKHQMRASNFDLCSALMVIEK